MYQLDVDAVFDGQTSGRCQLALGVVNTDHSGAAPVHPREDIPGPTSKIDRFHPGHVVGQQFQVFLREAPIAPLGLLVPRSLTEFCPPIGVFVPMLTISKDIVGQVGHPVEGNHVAIVR